MVNPYRFYTYAYLRKNKTPYYIGKGSGGRICKKGKGEVNPPKDKLRIIFLKQNLTEEEAFRHEIYMIAVFGRKDLGTGILYNKTNGGDGICGVVRTEEWRRKQSEAMKGKTPSPETRAKLSAANKNITPETRAKMSAANKGKTHSPETKAKMSAAKKNITPETRAKISAAKKGIPRSPETRAKLSAVNKGKTHSQESKEKMSAAKKGEIWITNGIQSRRISKNDIIPEGFRKGRTLTKLAQNTSTGTINVL